MSFVQRTVAAFAAVLAVVIGLAAFTSGAGAAPYTNQPTLSVSVQNPAVGGSVTITGGGFGAGESIDITLHTVVINLGTAKADASGAFTFTFTLPSGVSGAHTVVAAGQTSGRTASVSINIGRSVGGVGTGSGSGSGSSGGGGGLATTGAAIAGIGSVGLLLIVGGVFALVSGKRRRVAA